MVRLSALCTGRLDLLANIPGTQFCEKPLVPQCPSHQRHLVSRFAHREWRQQADHFFKAAIKNVPRCKQSKRTARVSDVVWRVLATHSIRQFPCTSPPCVTLCRHVSTGVFHITVLCWTAYLLLFCFPAVLENSYQVATNRKKQEGQMWVDLS